MIFDPYFTNKQNGVGVGLAATKDILLSKQIGVKVDSVMGEGTRFILLFEKNKITAKGKILEFQQPTVSRNKTLAATELS